MQTLIGFIKVTLLVAYTASSSFASEDLGQLGKVYPVIERDMTEIIKEKIAEKKQSGEIDRLHKRLEKRGLERVKRPIGVKKSRAISYRSFLIDPTYTVQSDIKDAKGAVLYPRGYSFNPLDIKPLTKTLCFIDGDDDEQIEWLMQYCGDGQEFKNILVNGDYQHAVNETGLRLYFDQGGYLSTKFRVDALPAVVRQSGKYLYVEEYEI